MVWIWFLVALVLLVAAIALLRLDAKQRGGGNGPARDDGRSRARAPLASADGDAVAGESAGVDDDEDPRPAVPADGVDREPGSAGQSGEPVLAPFQRSQSAAAEEPTTEPTPEPTTEPAAEPAPLDPTEPTVDSSPRLLDKVRALLPARRQRGTAPTPAEQAPADPLADSPVVRWLEDREFEPTPTPAPEFRHGDFAGGLAPLGTVSHGVFRGRRAIMGVTGGRTVLALRRDTASDVVLDLSRPDVDAEPGFHDAGEVGALEARTSDYGRLDLIDRDRLTEAVREVPADVRRVWAEGEWAAATIDGVDDPSSWDDVVMALHGVADVLAPFPPIGGRARALPAEIDPGAPAAAAGPEADPTVGMDGEVGTGTHGLPAAAGLPGSENLVVVDNDRGGDRATDGDEPADDEPVAPVPEPRRTGHLRLVPDRSGARDLTDVPVVADRGDSVPTADSDMPADAATAADAAGSAETDTDSGEAPAPEPDPFAEIMDITGPVPARGDVAADHLAPRPPLSRPSRGIGQAYPEDASVPPLAAGAYSGEAAIKPLGSEDDEDEIRDEVERFDAARIDGGSDLERAPSGRHGADSAESAEEETGRLSVAELAAKVGATPSAGRRRRRRSDDDEQPAHDDGDEADGRERPGVDPDVEQTARLHLPPDIRD
ncbi:hypothetical protein M3E10_14010 [Dietzia cinnamea]|uniref:Secreted protein n=1 Tax=Dietzia cinnamea TaxID=321318 RepID=A0AAW5Q8W9_9ACTN|nr:hypothetical protein [Dietzia cinnamea]MCT1864717.1 hypothetical protein [Dietzia cinnamea]MCT2029798.1 hypothetical protein [Dietzia cinnamea]MCT2034169.1 hypothetical protein [Dietzia cinnamea]MCT2076267.1 hypothetical protein [Dietzia cinnamea]MCT2106860.1 hypothetical protein [Dietzia cinnamea]